MFEQWIYWQIEVMTEDDPFVTGNQTMNEILDYYIHFWFRRSVLIERTNKIINEAKQPRY